MLKGKMAQEVGVKAGRDECGVVLGRGGEALCDYMEGR